jgi:hypothetical protein
MWVKTLASWIQTQLERVQEIFGIGGSEMWAHTGRPFLGMAHF